MTRGGSDSTFNDDIDVMNIAKRGKRLFHLDSIVWNVSSVIHHSDHEDLVRMESACFQFARRTHRAQGLKFLEDLLIGEARFREHLSCSSRSFSGEEKNHTSIQGFNWWRALVLIFTRCIIGVYNGVQ